MEIIKEEKPLPYNSVLESKHEYTGPGRKYPRKTFLDGNDNPQEITHELNEISNYIDYSVFSRNQLRFVEKLLKTETYVSNETYIRGPNFFIALDKPKYWNLNNYAILSHNIELATKMTAEMLNSIPDNYSGSMVTKAIDICKKINNYIIPSKIMGNDFVTSVRNFINLNNIMNALGIDYKMEDFMAVGLFCATYNKVISSITYFNPWVQVKKDAGVNTMTPPLNTIGNIKSAEINSTHSYTDNLAKGGKYSDVDDIRTREARDLIGKKSESKSKTKNGKITTKTKTANSYARIYAFPLYSLNILLPVKLMPTAFVKCTNFSSMGSILREAKLAGSILKIPINSILSKLITYNNATKRVSLNVIAKKNEDETITISVKGTIGDQVNLNYYRKVSGVRDHHYVEGTQTDKTTSFNGDAMIKTQPDDATLSEAEELLPKTIYPEPSDGNVKILKNDVKRTDTYYRQARENSLKENLKFRGARMEKNEMTNEMMYYVNGDDGLEMIDASILRYTPDFEFEFYNAKGELVLVNDPTKYTFDL